MNQKTYSGVSREDINKIRKGLGSFGIKMPDGDNVDVSGPLGVKIHVDYEEKDQRLTLSITNKPGWVSHSQIWKVIESSAGGFRKP
jgi:hypothetical protein